MKATKTKILAGAAALTLANPASNLYAQTYNPPPDPPYRGMQAGPGSSGHYESPLTDKVYLGFDLGAALQQDITISDSVGDSEKVSFDPGIRMDMMLGEPSRRSSQWGCFGDGIRRTRYGPGSGLVCLAP
jgi:hypothetical protein